MMLFLYVSLCLFIYISNNYYVDLNLQINILTNKIEYYN